MLLCELDPKFKQFNEIVIEIYKKSSHYNFESFFKNIESKKNIIYTLSEINEDIFDKEINIENKYGIFTRDNVIEHIQSNKEDNNLIDMLNLLYLFINEKDKKILILRFSENDLNNINSTNYVINSFQKYNPNLKDKIILFIVHKLRLSKGPKSKKEDHDYISFINDEYNQIFIDNLKAKI